MEKLSLGKLEQFKKSDQLYCFFLTRTQQFRQEAEKLMVGSAGQRRVQTSFLTIIDCVFPDEKKREEFGAKMNHFEQEIDTAKAHTERGKQLQKQLINQIFSE